MLEDIIGQMESLHIALVLMTYIIAREGFIYLRARKQGGDPVTQVHGEILTVKQAIDELNRDIEVLMQLHHDSDSKFATVHIRTQIESLEKRIIDSLQRIEVSIERRDS